VEHYRTARGLEHIDSLTYYETLYNFRLAVLLEGIYTRSLLDSTRADDHEMGNRALHNMTRALSLVEGTNSL
jgi:aminoglycoside phosphotransferase (APT) family kinase protein